MFHILQGDIAIAFLTNPLATVSTIAIPIGWFFLRKRKNTPAQAAILTIGAAIAVVANWLYLLSKTDF